ncbi:MAG: sigma-54 dependent transcriptional regulator [Desulfuromonadales bacterium]|nr:sigma-54 dependent transcriptional regulator [Desulfuromonadales bacterium]
MSDQRRQLYLCDPQLGPDSDLARAAAARGFVLTHFAAGDQLLKALAEPLVSEPALIVLDTDSETDWAELVRQLKARLADVPLVLVSGRATVRGAVQALQLGAADYLAKPVVVADLLQRLEQSHERRQLLAENRSLRAELRRRFEPDRIVCQSEGFARALTLARKVAASDASVLILGESGVGKELIASTIHHASPRCERNFLSINCAALTETLLESQLFGYVKGAFTGATSNQRGLVEAAEGGTLFLDEIGDISAGLQARLLRVLQEREYLPVGATRIQNADVRFLAATNRDLEAAVADGSFREDLYYRLNVVTLQVPPLRERRDDIVPLTSFFLERYGMSADQRFSPKVIELLQQYAWPGNVRELENVVEMACILAEGGTIELEHLPVRISQAQPAVFALPQGEMTLEQVERLYIEQVYRQTGFHKVNTARILDVSRKTLDRKLKLFAIGREPA